MGAEHKIGDLVCSSVHSHLGYISAILEGKIEPDIYEVTWLGETTVFSSNYSVNGIIAFKEILEDVLKREQ